MEDIFLVMVYRTGEIIAFNSHVIIKHTSFSYIWRYLINKSKLSTTTKTKFTKHSELTWDTLFTIFPIGHATVELVGESSTHEGRLEIIYSGVRGTVCNYNFDVTKATVICRMLGFRYLLT